MHLESGLELREAQACPREGVTEKGNKNFMAKERYISFPRRRVSTSKATEA